jgi:hypothetical protein
LSNEAEAALPFFLSDLETSIGKYFYVLARASRLVFFRAFEPNSAVSIDRNTSTMSQPRFVELAAVSYFL